MTCPCIQYLRNFSVLDDLLYFCPFVGLVLPHLHCHKLFAFLQINNI